MSRKKQESAETTATHSNFGHEIWGLIFIAISVLIFISLISHFITAKNILGDHLGTKLSIGLIFYFGKIAVFMFPLAIGYLGWVRLKDESLKIRSVTYAFLFTIEVCILFAIHHLPRLVTDPSFKVQSDYIGFLFVKLLRLAFGSYEFGPYFITLFALFITVLACFRISPKKIFSVTKVALLWCLAKLKASWQAYQLRMEQEKQERLLRKEEEAKLKENEPVKTPIAKQDEKKNAVSEVVPEKTKTAVSLPVKTISIEKKNISIDSNDSMLDTEEIQVPVDADDAARAQLEQELAAFRAKKRDPIKIMSIETSEADVEADAEGLPVENIQVSGIVQGITANTLDPESDIEADEDTSSADLDTKIYKVEPVVPSKPYEIPDPSILPDPPPLSGLVDKESIERNSMVLEKTLMNFGVEGKVVFVSPGPVVTRYEIELAPGIKVSRVLNLHDDISMAVNGQRIRIEAPIPGKSAVGIELPNAERQIVHFKHILTADAFKKSKAKLPVIIGTNISGAPYVTDITKMPHVLIAGQTGSGKSVCINSVICSLLMTKKPEELRLIMIDPKKVELAFYEGIPHLLSPVVTESKEAVKALQWGVIEMERRYRMLAKVGARNIDSFNTRIESGKISHLLEDSDNKVLPFIVIIVDELADLMMTASKDVEGLIQRIAQLARAVGIHLIVATQRPSVDIITGPIKANLTSRIGFRTIQSTDSRTILGHVGAEKLLGMGDMLFLRNGAPEIERFHGAFISEEDVEKIASEIRKQQIVIEKIESFHEATGGEDDDDDAMFSDGDRDDLFEEAARIIVSIGQGSTSLLQRRMKIGYARAGRLMDELERAGFVGPPDGSKAREVLVKPDEIDELLVRLR
jgi:DNA segregation ATPase FtsK/SpoIIIE-like protein